MRPGVIPGGGVGGRAGGGVRPFLQVCVGFFLPESAFRPLCPLVCCLCPGLGFLHLCLRAPLSESWVQALTSIFRRVRPRGPLRCSGLHRPQTEAEVLEQSAQTLRAHLGALLSALSRSVRACPAVVRATFRQLFRRVRERFPSAQDEVAPSAGGAGRRGESGGKRRGGYLRAW